MRIYCDMDDILCETAASLCTLAEREFGRVVAYEDVHEFNLQDVFCLTDAEMKRFASLSHEYDWLVGYPATPGAVEGVLALREAGHDVEIVTGRPASSHRATEDWLAAAGLGDFPVTFVDKYSRYFAGDPDDPRTVPLKELMARQYDVAIDDSPVVLPALAAWTHTKILVFARPWNQDFALAPNMVRVEGWCGLMTEIGKGVV